MKRGEMYWADLKPRSGSEQKGRRPVIIISHDGFNLVATWRSVIVIPMSTSHNQAKRGPTVVPIPSKETGLSEEGFAICHQVTTIDRSKLSKCIGALSRKTLSQVEEGLKVAEDLLDL